MRHRILNALLVLMGGFAVTSCLNSDDDIDYTYYNDAAITSVTLGTLNKYLPGEDGTLTKTTYTGSAYKFSIDQEQGLIFNPDSLPYGTDAEHVLTTIGTLNSGTVLVKNIDDDDFAYYVSSDSMDLTSDRLLRVYAQSGEYYRDYTLRLNVHKEDGEAFQWKSPLATDADGNVVGNDDIAALQGMKAAYLGGKVFLFGSNGAATVIYSSSKDDGSEWTAITPDVALGNEAYKNVIVHDDLLFILNDGNLLCSADGASWQTVKEATGLSQLVATSSWQFFGISESEGFMVSVDGGDTWIADDVEADNMQDVPTMVEGFTCRALKTNSGMEQLMLVGKNAAGKTVAWTRLADENNNEYTWSLVESGTEMPQLTAISVNAYDNAAMMIGLKDGTATNVLMSKDGGMNWTVDSRYKLPAAITSKAFTSVVDADNFIWLFYGQDGTVWRGRLNRLGWEKQ